MAEQPASLTPQDVIARLQALVDAKPSETDDPVERAIAAYYLGDLSALAGLSLRSRG
jgi:hypothetical protein